MIADQPANQPLAPSDLPIWTPSPQRIATARLTDFEHWLSAKGCPRFECYEELWQWTVDEPELFWSSVWDYFAVQGRTPYTKVFGETRMPDTTWFPGSTLNLADQIFRHAELAAPALIFESEAGGSGEMSWSQLRHDVASLSHTLRSLGIRPGDRVVAYLPNIVQTVVAFLATASIGAIWSVCSPELGPTSVIDRFKQIEPKILIACDGYRFGGKALDRRPVVAQLLHELDCLEAIIWVRHLNREAEIPVENGACRLLKWETAIGLDVPLVTDAVPFDHPLWILYSSGTTGLPKAIVHGHGGIILNGLVNSALHTDLKPGDRFFFSSSTSWMVWNAHIMGLLVGASLSLFDGAVTGPDGSHPDWGYLWRLAARQRIKVFGAGAAFYAACLKANIEPQSFADLEALESVCATGSPLTPESYVWIYTSVKEDLWLKCSAGGTDIASTFLCGTPTLPVYVGEMQCRTLGAAVYAFDDTGQPILNTVGELVCTRPLPSMPLFFWNDPDKERLRESYFDSYATPNGTPIWRHGDWLQLVPRSEATGGIIYGRSDATINRQGIRMGTAELYRAAEAHPQILDSLAVDLEYLGRDSYMALFVVLRQGEMLTDSLREELRKSIRTALSPRHVPNDIVQVEQIPRTLTGKKLELPIKKLLLGHAEEKVVNRDAMSNPGSIDWYVEFARRHNKVEAPAAI